MWPFKKLVEHKHQWNLRDVKIGSSKQSKLQEIELSTSDVYNLYRCRCGDVKLVWSDGQVIIKNDNSLNLLSRVEHIARFIKNKFDQDIGGYKDILPKVYRQRMIIEATTYSNWSNKDIVECLEGLTEELKMTKISGVNLSYCKEHGMSAWLSWSESGCWLYTWENTDPPFFSLDVYSCKEFNPHTVLNFIRTFRKDIKELAWKEI